MEDYNHEQRAAISCPSGVVIVPAGPGSGKSHTLVGRIIWRVENKVVLPSRIIVLTFTNNGAQVFADRLAERKIKVGWMGTVHSYCMRLIQEFGKLIGYRPRTVTVVNEDAKKLLLDRIRIDLLNNKITDKALKENVTPDANLVWKEYAHRLKRANMVDQDGILRDGLALLRNHAVQEQVEVDDLLVDERQDSGAIDSEIFWTIPVEMSRFFVGDVDQCIFAFRGAKPHIFVEEAGKYGSIPLSYNYRSDRCICKAATTLINHNTDRIDKPIVPVSKDDGLITVRSFGHDGDEIYGVWSLIREEAAKGMRYAEMAVLGRTNDIVDKFRETLKGLGVPVTTIRRSRMPPPADWTYTLNVIGLAIDPANDFMAEAILRYRKVQGSRINELKIEANRKDKWLSTCALLPNTRPVTLIDALMWISIMGVSHESMTLIQERMKVLPDDATLSDLLVDLTHRDRWILEDKIGVPDELSVRTIHGAKGSEWNIVFVVGMEEGILPHFNGTEAATSEKEIEEERRLCFVAMTRARHRLYLTWAHRRQSFGRVSDQRPSRFIAEMGLGLGLGFVSGE